MRACRENASLRTMRMEPLAPGPGEQLQRGATISHKSDMSMVSVRYHEATSPWPSSNLGKLFSRAVQVAARSGLPHHAHCVPDMNLSNNAKMIAVQNMARCRRRKIDPRTATFHCVTDVTGPEGARLKLGKLAGHHHPRSLEFGGHPLCPCVPACGGGVGCVPRVCCACAVATTVGWC